MIRIIGSLITLIAFSASTLTAQQKPEVFPLKDIHAGMKAIAYSIYEDNRMEEVPVEIIGIVKNMLGPRQDVILAHLGGKFEKAGVASGMSGSPVYIDGKWVGAISLRIGVFPTEPLAGITPAELMLEIKASDRSDASAAFAGNTTRQARPSASIGERQNVASLELPVEDQLMAAVANLLPPSLQSPSPNNYAMPIETPLTFSGFSRPVLDFFAPVFNKLGVVAVQGGGDSGDDKMASADEIKAALPPGSALGAMLATGDIGMGATGTVTYNDGQSVLAFGHPFFGLGPVEMPMTKGEVVTTFGSGLSPFKITNTTKMVGAIVQDRHAGVMGILGKEARMIPVSLSIKGDGISENYHFKMIHSLQWTPMVMMLCVFNALSNSNAINLPTSFQLDGKIHVSGYPDVSVSSLSATAPESQMPPGFVLANWISQRFNTLFSNRFERPEISGVELSIELIPDVRATLIEKVWSPTSEVHPGDDVPVKIAMRRYRGEVTTKEAVVKIPLNASKGLLKVLFSDSETASYQSQERLSLAQYRVRSLGDIINSLNNERSNQSVFITILEPTPTAFYNDKLLPNIPSTIANVMDSARTTSRLSQVSETALDQISIPVGMVVAGVQSLNFNVN